MDRTVEIGYSVLPQYQGHGYGTEMVFGLANWALSQPDVNSVVAETEATNTASRRLLEKIGFIPTGPGREINDIRYKAIKLRIKETTE